MKLITTLCSFVALIVFGQQSIAQTMTNVGSLVYVAPKGVLTVCGTFNVNSAGMVIAEDSSKVTVQGTMNVSNGSMSLNKSSLATILQDLVTGGTCGSPTGRVLRNLPGLLDVRGNVNNKGQTTNYSTILIGKDLNNDGELNNQSGALIDVSP